MPEQPGTDEPSPGYPGIVLFPFESPLGVSEVRLKRVAHPEEQAVQVIRASHEDYKKKFPELEFMWPASMNS